MPQNGIDKPLLGQILFFDTLLSHNGNQSCATCHTPSAAFVDKRINSAHQMVSQGDDETQFGNRNTPTMMYATFIPDFHYNPKLKRYEGGFFIDGRSHTLVQQAGQPILNPVEMGMPNKIAVAELLYLNPMYYVAFTKLYGDNIWKSTDSIYNAMSDALTVFQQQKGFLSPFDSKYDKALAGEYQFTPEEELGKTLFFDKKRTNCANCHQLKPKGHPQETFTNNAYYNIGVPKNRQLIAHNQLKADYVDLGLFNNPAVKRDKAQINKFRVPTLRNIAVTEPYMHNGVFRQLRTVLLYLDHFNNPARTINPETGKEWEEPEYAPTINHQDLTANALSDEEIDALEAFLETLTDEVYIPLLEEKKQQKE